MNMRTLLPLTDNGVHNIYIFRSNRRLGCSSMTPKHAIHHLPLALKFEASMLFQPIALGTGNCQHLPNSKLPFLSRTADTGHRYYIVQKGSVSFIAKPVRI